MTFYDLEYTRTKEKIKASLAYTGRGGKSYSDHYATELWIVYDGTGGEPFFWHTAEPHNYNYIQCFLRHFVRHGKPK